MREHAAAVETVARGKDTCKPYSGVIVVHQKRSRTGAGQI